MILKRGGGEKFILNKQRLGNLNEINFNGERLKFILKGLNPLCSYNMAFVIYSSSEGGYSTIGRHYLVNNTTNAFELIYEVYKNLEDLTVRYGFQTSDNLIIKY